MLWLSEPKVNIHRILGVLQIESPNFFIEIHISELGLVLWSLNSEGLLYMECTARHFSFLLRGLSLFVVSKVSLYVCIYINIYVHTYLVCCARPSVLTYVAVFSVYAAPGKTTSALLAPLSPWWPTSSYSNNCVPSTYVDITLIHHKAVVRNIHGLQFLIHNGIYNTTWSIYLTHFMVNLTWNMSYLKKKL